MNREQDDDDFQFGEMPDDDDSGDSHGLDNDMDAVNDETFGSADVGGGDDLEQYAAQSAHLTWTGAPHPSQLPLPMFERNPPSLIQDVLPSKSSLPYKLDLGTFDTIWGSVEEDPLTARYATNTGAMPVQNGATESTHGDLHHLLNNLSLAQNQPLPTAHMPAIASQLPGAMTLNDLERSHIEKAPVILTAAELERRLLAGDSGMSPAIAMMPRPAVPLAMQPRFVNPEQQLYFNALMRAQFVGELQSKLRPPFPAGDVNALLRGPSLSWPPPRLAPPPPPPDMTQPPPSTSHSIRLVRMQPMHEYRREQQMKRVGLPSGKTISDYALDPYAGLMSNKEREWLVKIQTLQCQGCGNPYEDDFYYTCWKARREASERRNQGLKPDRRTESCDFSATSSPHCYVPPTFAGSLGKPTLSTANYPRQLIDVSGGELAGELVDEDRTAATCSTSASLRVQRRFRSLLMQLEHAASLLVECDDRRRQLSSATLPPQLHGQLSEEVRSRLELLLGNVLSEQRIPTVLQVNKGRGIIARALAIAPRSMQVMIFARLCKTLTIAVARVPLEELHAILLPVIVDVTTRFSRENIFALFKELSFDCIAKCVNARNTFCQSVLLVVLVCAARKRVSLTEVASLNAWISNDALIPDEQWVSPSLLEWLAIDDVDVVGNWMRAIACGDEVMGKFARFRQQFQILQAKSKFP